MTTLPYLFEPREYQIQLLKKLDNWCKRALLLWHRRAGKDVCLWNYIIKRAMQEKGLYYYFLPTYTQGKKIIWDWITNNGFRFLNYIPNEIIASKNSTELKIELINNSIVQIIGTDNYDAIRGTNPIGCIFSEYAYHNPMVWEVVKPILTINDGWAVFNTTPNGKNHCYDLWEMAQNNKDWHTQILTVKDTNIISEDIIDKERKEWMSEQMIQQEYYCSFAVGAIGAFYADNLELAEKENRICSVPYDSNIEVYTAWDIGWSDDTSIIFWQQLGKEIRIIDHYSNNGMTVAEYIRILKDKWYNYGNHYFPHDAFAKRMNDGKSVVNFAEEYGLTVSRTPQVSILEWINQVRKIFTRLWFDKDKTKELVKHIWLYKREYNEKKKVFSKNPLHDFTSHDNDSLRYLSLCIQEEQIEDNSEEEYLNYNVKTKLAY